jgi:hypothetical protein
MITLGFMLRPTRIAYALASTAGLPEPCPVARLSCYGLLRSYWSAFPGGGAGLADRESVRWRCGFAS